MAEPQASPTIVQGFRGLNNRLDPTALGLEWQLRAENVLCDDAGYLTRRPGMDSFLSGFKDVYGTRNGRLLAITTGDVLVELTDSGDVLPLHTGVTGGPFQWAELGYALFLQSKAVSWAVYPDRVIPWGSLCPSPPAASYPLADPISYPPPTGEVIGARRSQMVVSVWENDRDRSILYFSRPDFPHEFRYERDFVMVPGRITMLAAVSRGIVIGTDRSIFFDAVDAPMERVADYGVPLNAIAFDDRDVVHFWSERGLCRIPGKDRLFENITDSFLSIQLRENTTAGILPYQGSGYAIVSMTGPLVSKQLARPYTPMAISSTKTQGIVV